MADIKMKASIADPYDWSVFPDAYMATSLQLCRAITPNSDLFGHSDGVCKEIGFRSAHSNDLLIYPIIYNFKHGIELYIKGLGCIEFAEYAHCHDFRELFDILISKTPDPKKDTVQTLKIDAWPIIEKYYFGTYVPSVRHHSNPDKQNEAERYPETGAYKLGEPWIWVTREKLLEIESDIKKLNDLFAEAKRSMAGG